MTFTQLGVKLASEFWISVQHFPTEQLLQSLFESEKITADVQSVVIEVIVFCSPEKH